MNDIRSKFEEIWPVPEGVVWDPEEKGGEYVPRVWRGADGYLDLAIEWDARLDTFTRCQETTEVYVSLVDELIGELDCIELAKDIWLPETAEAQHIEEMYALHAMRTRYLETLARAKQIMEQKK